MAVLGVPSSLSRWISLSATKAPVCPLRPLKTYVRSVRAPASSSRHTQQLTVAYVPSPSFSSCWKLEGCRLSIGSILFPPPRLLTDMLLSVLSPVDSVPTCVGCKRMSGGSRRVNFGSQRVARAVVS